MRPGWAIGAVCAAAQENQQRPAVLSLIPLQQDLEPQQHIIDLLEIVNRSHHAVSLAHGQSSTLRPLIVDATPEKIGRFVPGTHQRIVSPESVELNDFDVVLILPANHEAEITAKIRAKGFTGQIVLP